VKHAWWFLLLVACGDDSKSRDTTDGADTTDVAGTTALDTTPADTADTSPPDEVVESGCVPEGAVAAGCSSIDWVQEDASYPRKSDHHTTLVHTSGASTWLYVVGGITLDAVDETVFAEVRRAPIVDYGELGAWQDEAALPIPVGYAGQATAGDHVWVVAGLTQDADGVAASSHCFLGSFDSDGHLTFVDTTAMPAEVRLHPSAQILANRLVVVGGTNGQHAIDSVVLADVLSEGAVGEWRAGPTLPSPRSHHASVVHDGHIFVFGGFDEGNVPIADIWRSQSDADGEPTGWEVIGTMDTPPWTHAATLYRDGVFLVGGGEGGPGEEQYVDRVRWARFTADDRLTTFVDVVNPLPRPRSHVHQAPIFNGYIYSVGGRSARSFQSIADVFVGYLGF